MSIKHKLFYKAFRLPVILYLKLKFGYKYNKGKDLPESYIVLSNHTTDFDPLFVAASFKKQMYFVASEHITRWKKLYAFLRFGFEPIIRFKATVAGSTVVQILRKTKKGFNVCMFAEGVRSWDGVTSDILPSTGQLVKRAGCGLVTYRIVGGYHVSPVWASGKCRKGKVYGEIVGVYTKEQLAAMETDEINDIINRDLYEDAFARQKAEGNLYKGKARVEGLERLLYSCPSCGALDCMSSEGDNVSCKSCGKSFVYDDMCFLDGKPLSQMVQAQCEKTSEDVARNKSYAAKNAAVYVIDKKSSTLASEGELFMDTQELRCGDLCIPMDEVGDMAIHGNSSLVFSHGNVYYELKISLPDSAYKFLVYFQAVKRNGGN